MTFRTHRVLPYQPQAVYEAFARPELLAQWWGPTGFTSTFEIYEFRPGGRWKFGPHDDGTAITWVQEFEDAAVAARIRHIVEPANEQNLDRLLSVLAP